MAAISTDVPSFQRVVGPNLGVQVQLQIIQLFDAKVPSLAFLRALGLSEHATAEDVITKYDEGELTVEQISRALNEHEREFALGDDGYLDVDTSDESAQPLEAIAEEASGEGLQRTYSVHSLTSITSSSSTTPSVGDESLSKAERRKVNEELTNRAIEMLPHLPGLLLKEITDRLKIKVSINEQVSLAVAELHLDRCKRGLDLAEKKLSDFYGEMEEISVPALQELVKLNYSFATKHRRYRALDADITKGEGRKSELKAKAKELDALQIELKELDSQLKAEKEKLIPGISAALKKAKGPKPGEAWLQGCTGAYGEYQKAAEALLEKEKSIKDLQAAINTIVKSMESYRKKLPVKVFYSHIQQLHEILHYYGGEFYELSLFLDDLKGRRRSDESQGHRTYGEQRGFLRLLKHLGIGRFDAFEKAVGDAELTLLKDLQEHSLSSDGKHSLDPKVIVSASGDRFIAWLGYAKNKITPTWCDTYCSQVWKKLRPASAFLCHPFAKEGALNNEGFQAWFAHFQTRYTHVVGAAIHGELLPLLFDMTGKKVDFDRLEEFRQIFEQGKAIDTFITSCEAALREGAVDTGIWKKIQEALKSLSERYELSLKVCEEAADRLDLWKSLYECEELCSRVLAENPKALEDLAEPIVDASGIGLLREEVAETIGFEHRGLALELEGILDTALKGPAPLNLSCRSREEHWVLFSLLTKVSHLNRERVVPFLAESLARKLLCEEGVGSKDFHVPLIVPFWMEKPLAQCGFWQEDRKIAAGDAGSSSLTPLQASAGVTNPKSRKYAVAIIQDVDEIAKNRLIGHAHTIFVEVAPSEVESALEALKELGIKQCRNLIIVAKNPQGHIDSVKLDAYKLGNLFSQAKKLERLVAPSLMIGLQEIAWLESAIEGHVRGLRWLELGFNCRGSEVGAEAIAKAFRKIETLRCRLFDLDKVEPAVALSIAEGVVSDPHHLVSIDADAALPQEAAQHLFRQLEHGDLKLHSFGERQLGKVPSLMPPLITKHHMLTCNSLPQMPPGLSPLPYIVEAKSGGEVGAYISHYTTRRLAAPLVTLDDLQLLLSLCCGLFQATRGDFAYIQQKTDGRLSAEKLEEKYHIFCKQSSVELAGRLGSLARKNRWIKIPTSDPRLPEEVPEEIFKQDMEEGVVGKGPLLRELAFILAIAELSQKEKKLSEEVLSKFLMEILERRVHIKELSLDGTKLAPPDYSKFFTFKSVEGFCIRFLTVAPLVSLSLQNCSENPEDVLGDLEHIILEDLKVKRLAIGNADWELAHVKRLLELLKPAPITCVEVPSDREGVKAALHKWNAARGLQELDKLMRPKPAERV